MKLKRIAAAFVSAVMAFAAVATPLGDNLPAVRDSVSITAEADTNGYTADDAIEWAKKQVGKVLGNGQCVALITEYYKALGQISPGGNAYEYSYNKLPSGWNRYQGATPQKGDILVWTGGYGHVAIYESDTSTYHENWTSSAVQHITYFQKQYTYQGNVVTYWGVIRPDFASAKWYNNRNVENIGTGFYANIINTYSSKPVAVNGTNVELADQTSEKRAVWYFERRDDGSYKIKNCENNQVLDVKGCSAEPEANVQTYESNDTDAQRWFLYRSGNGYLLRPKCADNVLDAHNGGTTAGTNIKTWILNESGAQVYTIRKVDPPSASTVSVKVGTSYTPTVFTWTATSNTTEYDVKIWKGKLWDGEPYHVKWGATGFTYSIQLPEGHYEAYVDSCNTFAVTKSVNNLSFDVVKGECPHSYGEWTVVTYPTCTQQGEEKQVCSICQKVNTRKTNALGHNYSSTWTIDKQATCSAEGSQSKHCTRCSAVTEVTAIPKIPHSYKTTVVAPTLTSQGYTLHECAVCHYSYKDNYTAQLKIDAVTGVRVKTQGTTSLTLAWDKNASAKGYIVEQYKGGTWVQAAKTSNNTTLSCTVSGLKADTLYTFRIKGYVVSGSAEYGGEYTRLAGKTRFANSASFKATSATESSVTLSWSKNDKASGYVIEQYRGGKWTALATTKNNTTLTFTVKALAEGATYSFRMKSFRKTGKTTDFSEYTSIQASTKLGGTADFAVKKYTEKSITLSWGENAGATGYVLEQYKGGKWTQVEKLTKDVTAYTVSSLKADTTYTFRIKAYKTSAGSTVYSEYTRIAGKTRIPKVTSFGGTLLSASTVKLSWNKSDTASGYTVEQYKNGKWTQIAVIKSNEQIAYAVSGLVKGVDYSFRIKAYRTLSGKTEFSEYTTLSYTVK